MNNVIKFDAARTPAHQQQITAEEYQLIIQYRKSSADCKECVKNLLGLPNTWLKGVGSNGQ